MSPAAAKRQAVDAQLVHRLDRIDAACARLSQVAFDNRFASGQGFADWTAMSRVNDRHCAAAARAMFFADRAYRATQVAA